MPNSLDTTALDVQVPKAAYTSDQDPTNGQDQHLYNARGIVIDFGTWTDGTFTFDIEESDDDSTYTSVDASDLSGTVPEVSDDSFDDSQVYLTYSGNAKYLKGVVTVTDSPSTGLEFGIYGSASDANDAPVR